LNILNEVASLDSVCFLIKRFKAMVLLQMKTIDRSIYIVEVEKIDLRVFENLSESLKEKELLDKSLSKYMQVLRKFNQIRKP